MAESAAGPGAAVAEGAAGPGSAVAEGVSGPGSAVAEGVSAADRIRGLVAPVVEAESARLYDVEHNGGVLKVLVDADGGIGIDDIARLARAVSRELDAHDPIPGRYTLEVSSPGLERRLRTPDHFRGAVGSPVKLKTAPDFDGPRRVAGVLIGADDAGVEIREAAAVTGAEDSGTSRRIGYDEISWARTVFEWGPSQRSSHQREAAP